MQKTTFILILYTILISFQVPAQDLDTNTDSDSLTLKDVKLISIFKKVHKVSAAQSLTKRTKVSVTDEGKLDFGDTIVVHMENIGVLLFSNEIKLSDLSLYINEFNLYSIIPFQCCPSSDSLYFVLNDRVLEKEEKEQIKKLPGLFNKKVGVGIGIKDTNILYKCANPLFFNLKSFKTSFIIACVFGVILSIILILLCTKSSIIKDEGSLPSDKRPYSLSRTQLAWWTFIILTSYLFIYLVTGETDLLNFTAVTLLGISAGTSAVSTTIDSVDIKTDTTKRHQDEESAGWLIDILSDKGGVSIHRLQTVIFNLVFGGIFLRHVIANFTMPEFSANQLILLGVSAGAYTFVKNKENK